MSSYLNVKRHNRYKKILNYKSHLLKFGFFAIKAVNSGKLTGDKITNLERLLNKEIKVFTKNFNSVKFWNLIFVNSTLTALSSESRMGKGKGAITTKFCFIKPGQILFEFSGISELQVKQLYNYLKSKLPFKIKISKFL